MDGVKFAPCYARRMVVPLDGLNLHFIALEDFKTDKRASWSLQDLADLEALDSGASGQGCAFFSRIRPAAR